MISNEVAPVGEASFLIIINSISVILLVVVAWFVLKNNRRHSVILGWWTVMTLWTTCSCWYNDLGTENLELVRVTYTSLATTWLAAFNIVFLLGFALVAWLVGDRPLKRVDYQLGAARIDLSKVRITIYLAVFLVVGYLVYSFATGGIPVLMGVDRLTYMQEMAGPIERGIVSWSSLIAFILGYFRSRTGRWSIHGILLALLIIFAVLISAKFSLIVQLLAFYFAPVVIGRVTETNRKGLFRPRNVMVFTLTFLILATYAWSTYARRLENSDLAVQLLRQRVLANQGQIWWAVHNDVSRNGLYDRHHWQSELSGVIDPSGASYGSVGMPYLMIQMLGKAHAHKLFERGYLFTAAWPAVLVVSVPYWLALLMQFLAGILFFAILYYFYHSIKYRHFIRALISLTVLFPYLAMLGSGYLANFFTIGMLVKVVTLILLELGLPDRKGQSVSDSAVLLDPPVSKAS